MAKHAREPHSPFTIVSAEKYAHRRDEHPPTKGELLDLADAASAAIADLLQRDVPLDCIAVTFAPIGESFDRGVRAKAHAVPKPSNSTCGSPYTYGGPCTLPAGHEGQHIDTAPGGIGEGSDAS